MTLKDFGFSNQEKWISFIIERYRSITNWVGTILVAWLLAICVDEMITFVIPNSKVAISPETPVATFSNLSETFDVASDISKYMPICERNIFDSQKRTACTEQTAETQDAPMDPNAPPVKSDLKATLFGTMVSSIAEASFATIQAGNDKEPQTYHIGDEINKEAEIYEIIRNKVFFYRGNRKEYIEVDSLPVFQSSSQATTATPSSDAGVKDVGGKKVLTKAKVQELMGNMTDLIQQARMVPDFQNGVVQGFKVFAIRPGSIFEQLGLKNGDTISQINGTKIDSLEKALPMMELLKTESNIAIDINRGGAKQSISVNIQ